MKKFLMVWLPLLLIIAGGVGVGFYFLRSTPEGDEPVIVEDAPEFKEQSVATVYKNLAATKHIAEFEAQVASLTKLDSAVDAVFFAPSQSAVDSFVKDTALGLPKFIPYHVVVSETPLVIDEGVKLRTDDGQEVVIVKIDGNLYVRDAKGNDARLRKPVQAKNGKIYIIDKVLLTQ
jgi:uncharacterized surface protein with fasciclin (FAS1) repeats